MLVNKVAFKISCFFMIFFTVVFPTWGGTFQISKVLEVTKEERSKISTFSIASNGDLFVVYEQGKESLRIGIYKEGQNNLKEFELKFEHDKKKFFNLFADELGNIALISRDYDRVFVFDPNKRLIGKVELNGGGVIRTYMSEGGRSFIFTKGCLIDKVTGEIVYQVSDSCEGYRIFGIKKIKIEFDKERLPISVLISEKYRVPFTNDGYYFSLVYGFDSKGYLYVLYQKEKPYENEYRTCVFDKKTNMVSCINGSYSDFNAQLGSLSGWFYTEKKIFIRRVDFLED